MHKVGKGKSKFEISSMRRTKLSHNPFPTCGFMFKLSKQQQKAHTGFSKKDANFYEKMIVREDRKTMDRV